MAFRLRPGYNPARRLASARGPHTAISTPWEVLGDPVGGHGMTRISGWTVAGVLLAMLLGTIHAFADLILESRRYR